MDKGQVKEVFDELQKKLDTLQGKDATFLFIGHEGNHFAIGGDFNCICAQLIFAMCRYPVVRDIVKRCANRFDEMNEKSGDEMRSVKMTHLIEQNSGN